MDIQLAEMLFLVMIFISAFIQTLTGFGGPLIAMPFCILLVGLSTARPIVSMTALVSGLMVAVPMFRDIKWKQIGIMGSVMMAGVILSDFVFKNVSLNFLLIFYGAVVLVIGARRLFSPESVRLPLPAQYCAVGLAGLMQGLFISGGSFLVLYAVEQIKEKDEFRATVSGVWVILNIYIVASCFIKGVMTPPVLALSAWSIIPAGLGIGLAMMLARKLSREFFLKATYVILILSGAVLLINCII